MVGPMIVESAGNSGKLIDPGVRDEGDRDELAFSLGETACGWPSLIPDRGIVS